MNFRIYHLELSTVYLDEIRSQKNSGNIYLT